MANSLQIGPDIWRARLGGRRVVVSYSGGKDSAAVCGALRAEGVEFDAVWFDTGWESADTYAFISEYGAQVAGKPIIRLAADLPVPDGLADECAELEGMLGRRSDMIRRCLKYACLPYRLQRWCTRDLKLTPFARWARSQGPFVNAIGVRAAESRARSRLDEWEQHPVLGDVEVWRPIFRWTEDDVIAAHHEYGLPVNPLYLRGSLRVGCWPCVMAGKHEIRTIATDDPERIAVIRRLEEIIQLRVAKTRGETRTVGWFMNPRPVRDPVTRRVVPGQGGCWPIDKVVDWAGTHQPSLLDEVYGNDRGCMRWGMCSASPKEVSDGE
jgi:3'-phosphoadenosine 5'-phosphosulfate sulfotransferase (PAPS reductase)/FAD synthetase